MQMRSPQPVVTGGGGNKVRRLTWGGRGGRNTTTTTSNATPTMDHGNIGGGRFCHLSPPPPMEPLTWHGNSFHRLHQPEQSPFLHMNRSMPSVPVLCPCQTLGTVFVYSNHPFDCIFSFASKDHPFRCPN